VIIPPVGQEIFDQLLVATSATPVLVIVQVWVNTVFFI